MTAYQMCIANIAIFLRSSENQKNQETGQGLDAFAASHVIAIAFCKIKEEVIFDITNYKQE